MPESRQSFNRLRLAALPPGISFLHCFITGHVSRLKREKLVFAKGSSNFFH
jgi:hypothetical protein